MNTSCFSTNNSQITGLFGQSIPQAATGTSGHSLFSSTAAIQPNTTSSFLNASNPVSSSPGSFGGTLFSSNTPFGAQNTSKTAMLPTTNQSLNMFTTPTTQNSSSIFSSNSGSSLFGGNSGQAKPARGGTKNIFVYEYLGMLPGDISDMLQAIVAAPSINQTKNFEELRWEDYQLIEGENGKAVLPATSNNLSMNSGSSLTNMFGNTQKEATSGLFGTPTAAPLFQGNTSANNLFGTQTNQPVIQNTGLFGAQSGNFQSSFQNANTASFGSQCMLNQPQGLGLFGKSQTQSQTNGIFGSQSKTSSTQGLFGTQSTPSQGTGLFGNQPVQQQGTGIFGNQATANQGTGLFGNQATSGQGTGLFGNQSASTQGTGLFGNKPTSTQGTGLFGNQSTSSQGMGLFGNQPTSSQGTGLFGNQSTSSQGMGLFGNQPTSSQGTGLFGNQSASSQGTGLFGNQSASSQGTGLFGSTATPNQGTSLFGNQATTSQLTGLFARQAPPGQGTGLFGSQTAPGQGAGLLGNQVAQSQGGGLFGSQVAQSQGTSLFGNQAASSQGTSLFGNQPTSSQGTGLFGNQAASSQGTGLFGNQAASSQGTSLFGNQAASSQGTGLFGNQPTSSQGTSLFGNQAASSQGTSLFGNQPTSSQGTGLFGNAPTSNLKTGLFGNTTTLNHGTGLFGSGPTLNNSLMSSNLLAGGSNSLFSNNSSPEFGNMLSKPTNTSQSITLNVQGNQQIGSTGYLYNNPGQTSTSIGTPSLGSTNLFSQPSVLPGSLGVSKTSSGFFNGSQQFSCGGGPQSSFFNNSVMSGTNPASMVSQQTPSMFSNGPNSLLHGSNPSLFSSTGYGNGSNTNVGIPTTTFSLGVSSVARECKGLSDSLHFGNKNNSVLNPVELCRQALSPLLFLGNEKAFPNVYRRYKTAALAQVWKPLPEHTIDYRSKMLPSLTPKRFCRPRYSFSFSTHQQHESFLQDTMQYVDSHFRAAATGAALDIGLTPVNTRYHASVTSRFGSVFRRISYHETEPLTKNSYEEDGKKYLKNFDFSNDFFNVHVGKTPNATVQHSAYDSNRRRTNCEKEGTPWLGKSQDEDPLHQDVGSKQLHESNEYEDICFSSKQMMTQTHTLRNVTRRTGRLGLDSKRNREAKGSVTMRRWEAVAPICRQEGYSTRPSLEALQLYSERRLASVEDFTVIHEGFGEITWPGLTDVRGLCIDDIVVIEDKAVEVYPESSERQGCHFYPSIGVGLNKPALITLHNCGPHMDYSNESSSRKKKIYENHVEKMRVFTHKIGAQFISLSPQWTWKFRVLHF